MFDPNLAQNNSFRACLGISGMKGNEGHWGGEISIISQNFPKSPSILFHPLESSISQTRPYQIGGSRVSGVYSTVGKKYFVFFFFFGVRCRSAGQAQLIRASAHWRIYLDVLNEVQIKGQLRQIDECMQSMNGWLFISDQQLRLARMHVDFQGPPRRAEMNVRP
jgi:hypothetical protein